MYDFEGIQRTGCITTENEQRRSEKKKKSKKFERFLLSVPFTFPGIIVCFCQCLIKQREIISNEQNNYIFNIAMLEV